MICLVVCLLGLGVSATAQEFLFITTFDAPGAGRTAEQGTWPQGIISGGTIVGYYEDAKGVYHGFLRDPHGRFTIIDEPNAATSPGQGTQAYGMNPQGAITGWYEDWSGLGHGFLRDPHGNFTSFDAPPASVSVSSVSCTEPDAYTEGASINSAGWIAGDFVDGCWGADHGFLRDPSGNFTEFDAPDSIFPDCAEYWFDNFCEFYGTETAFFSGINPAGTMTGWFWGVWAAYEHSWVGTPSSFTEFDAPSGAITPDYGSWGNSINPAGTVTGGYLDQYYLDHGYLRAPDGTITTFDVPHSYGTDPVNINPSGAIVGNFWDSRGVAHGFSRAPNGRFTTFDAPGAGHGSNQGTFPYANNPEGSITGVYVDWRGVYHGFVASPLP
jgi:hypothetical protein